MAYADLGVVLMNEGRQVEAIQAIYQSFLLSDDLLQRTRVLGDLGVALLGHRGDDAARTAFDIVLGSKTSFAVRLNAVLELMDMESAAGNRMAFERRRNEGEAARSRMPPSMLADFLFKSGVGLARFGQIARARELLLAGQQHARSPPAQRLVLPVRARGRKPGRVRNSRARSHPPGRAGASAGHPRGGNRASRFRPAGDLVVGSLPFERGLRLVGRTGGVAARAGRGGQAGERQ